MGEMEWVVCMRAHLKHGVHGHSESTYHKSSVLTENALEGNCPCSYYLSCPQWIMDQLFGFCLDVHIFRHLGLEAD